MVTTILSQEVKDYETWKKVFREDVPPVTKQGGKVKRIFRPVDNPKIVTIIDNKKHFTIEQVN